MIKDEIVEEVRSAREEYARRFDFDLWAMYRDLKAREGSRGHQVVHLEEDYAPGIEENQ